jgi:hypothetical protein
MEILFAPLLFVVLILLGPFVALNAYLLVWLCGPAIRRAGRKWEEGCNQAMAESWELKEVKKPFAPFGYVERPDPPPVARPHEPPHAQQAPAADDAGHRWLGGTEDKTA